jgi:DNA repair photolyase
MAPILPGLSDGPELLADVVRAARDAGATSIWTGLLNLRPGTREHFLENLARDWPELLPRYERLYRGRAYLGKDEVEPVRREVAELRERFEIGDRRRVRILPTVVAASDEQLDLGTIGFGSPTAIETTTSRSA